MTARRRLILLVLPGALMAAGTAALARRADQAPDIMAGVKLGPTEMTQQAADYVVKMNAIVKHVSKLQEDARKKKDVIKLNCVTDKWTQLQGHVAVANQTHAALTAAVSRADDGARQHEFTRMTIIFQKVTVLGTEAENCIGEDASYVGDTKVDIDIDPNIPQEDPTEPQLPLPDVSRPPEASPFV